MNHGQKGSVISFIILVVNQLNIRKGNGNPLQYSCLENLRDRGDWWAAIYGVAQSRTRLKRLSSSSSSSSILNILKKARYKSYSIMQNRGNKESILKLMVQGMLVIGE